MSRVKETVDDISKQRHSVFLAGRSQELRLVKRKWARGQGVSWGYVCNLDKVLGEDVTEEVTLSKDLKEVMRQAVRTN